MGDRRGALEALVTDGLKRPGRVLYSDKLARALNGDEDLGFLVIGGGGWIGRATLDLLHSALGDRFRHRVTVLGSSTRRLSVAPGVEIDCLALGDYGTLEPRPAILLHNAFLTRDKVAQLPLDAYIAANERISDQVDEICRRWRPQGILLPSSGAAYGRDGAPETDMAANPYGVLKVRDERRFAAMAANLGASFCAPRIFGLSGEFINKTDTYVLADIIGQLVGGAITLRATRPVYRSYIYVGALLELCLLMLLDQARPSLTFDTAGREVVEVGQLATLIADTLGHGDAPIARQFDPAAPADRYYGDGAVLFEEAERYGVALPSLREQVLRTAAYLDSV